MRNKRLFIFLSIFLAGALFLAACSASAPSLTDQKGGASAPEYQDSTQQSTDTEDVSTATRKIIYRASFTLKVADVTKGVNEVRNCLEADEWFDSEVIGSDYARLVARVKSDRLDEFITEVSAGGEVYEYQKTATDISIEYSNKQLRIDALVAEQTRLLELMENANLNETLTINSRLSTIEAEIAQLTRDLNGYNSLIDFSTVTITLSQTYQPPAEESFGQTFKSVFIGAFKALLGFFKFLLLAITAIFPFALVALPVTFGTIYLVKFLKKRKKGKAVEPAISEQASE